MRLIPKSEISKAQANDRAKEVAEGLKLSRKVDGLRELMAKEEQALDKFRTETLSAIGQETTEAVTLRDELLSEIKSLREEKSHGLKDIELRGSELRSFEESLNEREKKLHIRKSSLEAWHDSILNREVKINEELQRAMNTNEEAERLHKEADDNYETARKMLISAQQELLNTTKDKEEMERSMAVRAQILAEKEKNIADKEEELEERDLEITTLKRQLQDKIATMDRNIKRNG